MSANYREIVIPELTFDSVAKAAESGGQSEIMRILYTLAGIRRTVGEFHEKTIEYPEVAGMIADSRNLPHY